MMDAGKAKRPVFSRRTNWDLGENVLASACRAARESGKKLLDLTVSNPTRCGFDYGAFDPSLDFASRENLKYNPDPLGLPVARKAVRDLYAQTGVSVPENRLMLSSSTSEAYSHLFRLLCNPADAILAPVPSYPLFQFLADVCDVTLSPYRLQREADGWRIDRASLLKALSSKTRAIIVVSPNNPTGSYLDADDADFLCRTAQARGLAVICDEVFADYPIAPRATAVRTLAGREGPLTFVLGGLSKLLAMPQMKLAWILTQGEGAEEACRRLEMIADTFLSVNAPVQNALPLWMPRRKEIQGQVGRRIAANMEFLRTELKGKPGIVVPPVEGGWYALVAMDGIADEDGFALNLLEERGVVIHPGYFYELGEDAYAVLSLLTPEDIWREGVRALAEHHALVSVL
jgi:aspartate/methionine/tyrosine aminotransferase